MKDFTHIGVVLDRSGSMSSVRDQTVDGFDEFVKKQQAEGDNASITVAQFDDQYDIVFDEKPINEVPSIKDIYEPRGMTALLDAVGKTINFVGERLRKKSEADRPDKVVFVIITDGYENASREYTRERIFEMIRHQESKYKWEFIFLGANQDAIKAGMSMGIKAGSSADYAQHNTQQAFNTVSNTVNKYRGMAASFRSAINTGDAELFDEDERTELTE